MKFSASTVLLAAALGVSAHPHGAAHPHARRDTNLDVRDTFYRNAKPSTATVFQTVTVNAVNAAAAPTTTSTSAAAAATSKAATTSSSSGNIGSSGSYSGTFCTGSSKRADLEDRATVEEIKYAGNLGSTSFGCNLKLVEQSEAKNYQYISVLENAASQKQVCACFLKMTSPTQMDGFWSGKQVLDFTLDAGEAKYLAVEAGSIGGCSCGVGALPTTSIGQISGVWYEWEFGSTRNTGFSGADASSLVPEDNGQTFQGMSLSQEGSDTVSIIYPNGDGCNAFPKGTNLADGHGFNLANTQPGGTAIRLHAKWGTTGSLSDCPKAEWKQTRG